MGTPYSGVEVAVVNKVTCNFTTCINPLPRIGIAHVRSPHTDRASRRLPAGATTKSHTDTAGHPSSIELYTFSAMGVYRVVLSMLLLGTETIRATRETRPKLVHINRLPSDISADAGTTEVERSPLHVAVSGELSGTEALQSDVLCGLALFGGAAFVWQLPVLMDASISVGLRLAKSQSIQASTAIFVAWSIGSMLLGKLADQFGRKTVAVASGWVTVIHLLLISYATSLNHFVLARLLEASHWRHDARRVQPRG